MDRLPRNDRDQTRRLLQNMNDIPRYLYEPYRDALSRRYIDPIVFETVRDANVSLAYVKRALSSLHQTEAELINADARLRTLLENLTDYVHTHVDDLDPLLYHALSTIPPTQLPPITSLRGTNERAATPFHEAPVHVNDPATVAHTAANAAVYPIVDAVNSSATLVNTAAIPQENPVPVRPPATQRPTSNERAASRRSRRAERTADIAYPQRTPQSSQPSSTSSPSPPDMLPDFPSYEDYIHEQEALYGRDSDGEVRTEDAWAGYEAGAED